MHCYLWKMYFLVWKRAWVNWGFIFAWDLGVIFLGIPSFKILRFRKKIFFQIHRKIYRFFPYIPIFRRFFWITSVKKNLYVWLGKKWHCYLWEMFILVWKRVWVWNCKSNLRMLIQINTNVVATAYDLILVQNFHL